MPDVTADGKAGTKHCAMQLGQSGTGARTMGRDSLTSGDGTFIVERHLMTTLKKPQRAYQNPSEEIAVSFGGVLSEKLCIFS